MLRTVTPKIVTTWAPTTTRGSWTNRPKAITSVPSPATSTVRPPRSQFASAPPPQAPEYISAQLGPYQSTGSASPRYHSW